MKNFKYVLFLIYQIKNLKDIYKNTIYGNFPKIWRNYFDLLFEREHYQDYL